MNMNVFYKWKHTGTVYRPLKDNGTSWEGEVVALGEGSYESIGDVKDLHPVASDSGKAFKQVREIVQVLVKSPEFGAFYVSTEFADFKNPRVTRTFRTIYV